MNGPALVARLGEGAAALVAFAARETVLAAIVFAAVYALTRALRRRSPRLYHTRWALVLLRLVLPPDLAAPWSARALAEGWLGSVGALGEIGARVPAARAFRIRGGAPGADAAGGAPSSAAQRGERQGSVPRWPTALAGVWLTGAKLAGALLFARRRLYRRAAASARPVADRRLVGLAEDWRLRLRVRRPVALRISDRGLAPYTVGLRPLRRLPLHQPRP